MWTPVCGGAAGCEGPDARLAPLLLLARRCSPRGFRPCGLPPYFIRSPHLAVTQPRDAGTGYLRGGLSRFVAQSWGLLRHRHGREMSGGRCQGRSPWTGIWRGKMDLQATLYFVAFSYPFKQRVKACSGFSLVTSHFHCCLFSFRISSWDPCMVSICS